MKKHNAIAVLCFLLLGLSLTFTACKEDEREPPEVEFKTGSGYTFANATVGQGDSLMVGITATKTEDELMSYNVSYAYDGATTTTTSQNFSIPDGVDTYDKDVTIVTRSQAGSERWVFTVTDRDGNITTKEFTLTVN